MVSGRTRAKAALAACTVGLIVDIYLLFWLASLPRQWAVNASVLVGLFVAIALAVGMFASAYVLDELRKKVRS